MADMASSLPIRTLANGDAAVGILNSADERISIALEGGNIADIKSSVAAIDTSLDVALSTVATEITLASIKDTAGIKKITDALPAGTNLLGKVNVTDGVTDLAVNTNGSLNVNVVSNIESAPITDYDTQSALAVSAEDTHTYTAIATFILDKVWAAASGKMRIEIKIGPATFEVTKYVGFNSNANPNIDIPCGGISVASGDNVLVIRKNMDNQAMDVYSTISGQNV